MDEPGPRKLAKLLDCDISIHDAAGRLNRCCILVLCSLYLQDTEELAMTQLEVAYRYGSTPGENTMRALDSVREVYGIRRIRFDEKERVMRVEFDASRLKEPAVASLLRGAGIDLKEKLVLA